MLEQERPQHHWFHEEQPGKKDESGVYGKIQTEPGLLCTIEVDENGQRYCGNHLAHVCRCRGKAVIRNGVSRYLCGSKVDLPS